MSYRAQEIVWGVKFDDMYVQHPTKMLVDLKKIHDHTSLALGPERL